MDFILSKPIRFFIEPANVGLDRYKKTQCTQSIKSKNTNIILYLWLKLSMLYSNTQYTHKTQ